MENNEQLLVNRKDVDHLKKMERDWSKEPTPSEWSSGVGVGIRFALITLKLWEEKN